MINSVYFSLFLVFIVFLIFCYLNRKIKNIRTIAQNSIIDSVTFTSGLILFIYLVGKALSIKYLTEIDEFSLALAILISSIFLMSAVSDKYYNKRGLNKKKKNGRT